MVQIVVIKCPQSKKYCVMRSVKLCLLSFNLLEFISPLYDFIDTDEEEEEEEENLEEKNKK
jgi:hypothetical protein